MTPTEWIPKDQLKVGAYYYGKCRNANAARWDGNQFHHWRTKFGHKFIETIRHPEDDEVFDVFYPIREVDYGVEAIPFKENLDEDLQAGS